MRDEVRELDEVVGAALEREVARWAVARGQSGDGVCSRAIDDPALAAELFRRVEDHVPRRFRGSVAAGANERFRCYRYERGQRFALHRDGAFIRNASERSFLTFMVYLNEGFEGGETMFLEPQNVIAPKTGMALFFQHPILHEGCEVTRGVKYVLRSDVMYRGQSA